MQILKIAMFNMIFNRPNDESIYDKYEENNLIYEYCLINYYN